MRKKSIIISICIISAILFCLLVYYGLRYSRGIPVILEKKEKPVLEVTFIDKDIDLTKNIFVGLWNTITPKEIELKYQVMVLPWGKSLMSPITVKAFHSKKYIYFYTPVR